MKISNSVRIFNPENYPLPYDLDRKFQEIYELFSSKFFEREYDIEVFVVGKRFIRKLNFLYRKINGVTDVLSFPLNPLPMETLLGSIYFCYPVIERNNKNLCYEFSFLFIHSLLHLMGYDHGKEMFSIQKEVVDQCFPCR